VQFLAVARPVLIGENKVSSVFVDRQNCLLVPLANTQAIAKAVAWAAAHPAECEAIGRRGRKLYESHFSQAVVNEIATGIVKEL
jgi:glycosyltransferase involved in cell wall biosynthesis